MPQDFSSRRAGCAGLLACGLAVLAGCAGIDKPTTPAAQPSKSDSQPAPPGPSAADRRAAAPAALAAERKWLQSLFAGTPVRIAQTRDGPLTVEVPREFCFEAGASDVKPPLAAVLDKVSQSLARLPLARVTVLAAPDDAGDGRSPPLAQQRAAQLHKHLLARGVPAARIGKPSIASVAAVQLQLIAAPPA